jgi:hypothetical protein
MHELNNCRGRPVACNSHVATACPPVCGALCRRARRRGFCTKSPRHSPFDVAQGRLMPATTCASCEGGCAVVVRP